MLKITMITTLPFALALLSLPSISFEAPSTLTDPPNFKMDIVAVLDLSMLTYYENIEAAQRQVTKILSPVQELFRNPILGQSRIDLNPVKFLEVPQYSSNLFTIMDKMKDSRLPGPKIVFKNEMKKKLARIHHDGVIFFTRESLGPRKEQASLLSFAANSGTICVEGQNSVMVMDGSPTTPLQLAHELGHLLNMSHVNDKECELLQGSRVDGDWDGQVMANHVMTLGRENYGQLSNSSADWTWSRCSQTSLKLFLESEKANCLRPSKPFECQSGRMARNVQKNIPDAKLSVDRQCKDAIGNSSLNWQSAPFGCQTYTACANLLCVDRRSGTEKCIFSDTHWADGTPCTVPSPENASTRRHGVGLTGDSDNSDDGLCVKGHCIEKNTAVQGFLRSPECLSSSAWMTVGPSQVSICLTIIIYVFLF